MSFVLGLDLATKRDYSALCAIQCGEVNGYSRYVLHALERLPHGVSYPRQIAHVAKRLGDSPALKGAAMAVDETGVGAAVVDMLRQAGLPVSVWPILITGGTSVSYDEDRCCHRVPKRHLVSTVSGLMEHERLKMVAGLTHEELLKRELHSFTSKITQSGNEVFEAWRESDHDDMVLAIAMALWLAENTGLSGEHGGHVGEPGVIGTAPPEVFIADQRPATDWRHHGGTAPETGIEFPRW